MIVASLFGLLLGIIAGILPGIGPASIILLTFPIWLSFDPVSMLIGYLSLAISTQYVSCVTAIYLGIPGAESAAATAKEFGNIRRFGVTRQAIIQNATSSVLGNLIGIGIFLAFLPLLNHLSSFYQNKVMVAILSLTYVTMAITSEKRLEGVLGILVGTGLMTLGYNPNTFTTINFGLSFLDNGIPWPPLVLGSLIGYGLYSIRPGTEKVEDVKDTGEKEQYLGSATFGGLLGFFVGFVPGLSYILASILMYNFENRRLKAAHPAKRTLNSIAASEAAHSSAAIAALVPFLVFMIPITASEAVIMNALTLTTTLKDTLNELLSELWLFFGILIAVNLVSFLIALYSRALVNLIFGIPEKIIKGTLAFFGLIAVYSSTDYSTEVSLITYGFVLLLFSKKGFDPLPFVMSVLLFPTVQNTYYLFRSLA